MRQIATYPTALFINQALLRKEGLCELLNKEVHFIISLIALTSLRLKVKASDKVNAKGKKSPKRQNLHKPNSQ